MKKYFDILGLKEDASKKEIKKRYKELALKHHPDRGGDEEEFKKITEAYEILIGKRKDTKSPQSGFESYDPFYDEGFLKHIMRNMRGFKGYGFDIHDDRPPANDKEVVIQFKINIEDVKKGVSQPLNYELSKNCKDCNGEGGFNKNSCVKCDGKGFRVSTNIRDQMRSTQASPCFDCLMKGYTFEKNCDFCNGKGWISESKQCIIEIKEKK